MEEEKDGWAHERGQTLIKSWGWEEEMRHGNATAMDCDKVGLPGVTATQFHGRHPAKQTF